MLIKMKEFLQKINKKVLITSLAGICFVAVATTIFFSLPKVDNIVEQPSPSPTVTVTPIPTAEPTQEPTPVPTVEPTQEPTPIPTVEPTPVPVVKPTAKPQVTPKPTATPQPTPVPTAQPTQEPVPVPTAQPTQEPTPVPTAQPTQEPTPVPVPEEPYIVSGYISDGLFNTEYEARVYAESPEKTLEMINKGYTGYRWSSVKYSDGTVKYTIEWY